MARQLVEDRNLLRIVAQNSGNDGLLIKSVIASGASRGNGLIIELNGLIVIFKHVVAICLPKFGIIGNGSPVGAEDPLCFFKLLKRFFVILLLQIAISQVVMGRLYIGFSHGRRSAPVLIG